MPSWVTPKTDFTASFPLGATNMNDIGTDLGVLYTGATANKVYYAAGATSSTTSTFADSDATNHKLDITIEKTKVLAVVSFVGYIVTSGTGYYDLILGATRAGDATYGLGATAITVTNAHRVTLLGLWTGLTPGTHTLKIQYKNTGGGTVAIANANVVTMLAWEL